MVNRITVSTPCYMQLDGQWQIVLPGSVIDVPSASVYIGSAALASDAAGTLASHGKPTPVRNIRTR